MNDEATVKPRGGYRAPAQVSEEFRAAWRTACRRAEKQGAWTFAVPQRSVDVLCDLAAHGPTIGPEIAARTGAARGNLEHSILPRLAELDLITWDEQGWVKVWRLTTAGRTLAELHDI